jgi:hypothetical protein
MSARALRRVKAMAEAHVEETLAKLGWLKRGDLREVVALAERAVELERRIAAFAREAPHSVSCPQWGGGKEPCDCYTALSPPRAGKRRKAGR